MAWVSFLFGAIGALVTTVIVSVIIGFPLWLSLLLYPVLVVCISCFIFAGLLLRSMSGQSEDDEATNGPADHSNQTFALTRLLIASNLLRR